MLKHKLTAPFNCDSVEINGDLDTIFVGMYEYEESSSTRGGGFLILDKDGQVQRTNTADFGCLDAKWITDDLIIIACSDGVVRIYSVGTDSIVSELPVVDAPSSTNTANIIMTIDTAEDVTAIITAKGQLSIIKDSAVVHAWEAHSPVMESWCCGFNPSASVVVSGSDDCSLRFWDAKNGELIATNAKSHRMGTTCVEFINEHELFSGSYDDRIRKFDMRMMSEPLLEFKSIGGIWRLKPLDGLLYVAACYGGCQILTMDELKPVVQEYSGHESMAYGIGPLGDNTVVSCSFYDKSVHLWTF